MSNRTGRKQVFLDERELCLIDHALTALEIYCKSDADGKNDWRPERRFTKEAIKMLRAKLPKWAPVPDKVTP